MRVRKRKGISYILEVVMMTLVITALASVVLTWGLGQVSNSRIALTNAVNDRISRTQETINVEDVQMLTSSTMRVYVRNAGAIQVVIDQIYVNNVNTAISGTCPAGSFQAGTATITSSTSSIPVTLSANEPSASYSVTLSTSWGASPTVSIAASPAQSTTGFTISLSSARSSGSVNWFTNYAATPGCSAASSLTKLSLAINGVGAVDVSVPNSVSSCTPTPPVCPGNSYTVTASTNRGTTVTGSFTV